MTNEDNKATEAASERGSAALNDGLGASPFLIECIVEALMRRCEELKGALETAKEAMDERRGYADGWEWKYGKAWDEEDTKVKSALERGA